MDWLPTAQSEIELLTQQLQTDAKGYMRGEQPGGVNRAKVLAGSLMTLTTDTATATPDFAARKQAALSQLATLREQRGTALAEGTTFDDKKVALAQIELERITDE